MAPYKHAGITIAEETARLRVLSPPMAAGLLAKLKDECEAQHARAEAAETLARRYREALEDYGEHLMSCAIERWVESGGNFSKTPAPACTCGLSALLKPDTMGNQSA